MAAAGHGLCDDTRSASASRTNPPVSATATAHIAAASDRISSARPVRTNRRRSIARAYHRAIERTSDRAMLSSDRAIG